MNRSFFKQPPVVDEEGNREYKWKLHELDDHRLQHFVSQMKFRLFEGNGKAIYILGVLDDGKPIGINKDELDLSIKQMERVVKVLGAKIEIIRFYDGIKGIIATLKVTININDFVDNFFT